MIYRDGLREFQIISSFESESCDLIEVKVKLDLPITTKNYIESNKIEEIPPVSETQYPNEILSQFSDFNPDNKGTKLKHKYTIQIYKSHFNPEMFELTQDYEMNVHKRKSDTLSKKFVKEFMAYSPLYDSSVPSEA